MINNQQSATDYLKSQSGVTAEILDNWRMILTPEEIDKAVRYCAGIINEKFRGKKIVICCILKGAVFFFVDLTRYLTIHYSCYFIEASSYHNNQTQSEMLKIESSINPSKFVDRHVILLDELFDNGFTINQIKSAISTQASVPLDMIYTCTLFKKMKVVKAEPPNLHGLLVPDIWLVGYGLDDQQEKRGWTYLYACPKCDSVQKTLDDEIFVNDEAYGLMRITMIKQLENFGTI
jgi:hypoxanthine phosphoribosyltransferase